MIEIFLNNFIKPQYRERLLYELKSSKTNKRDKAFTKLLDYKEYFNSDIEKIDLPIVGPALETNKIFPRKTNVEFAQKLDDHTLRMRVWERGAGITQACGTGSCAAAVAAVLTGRTAETVRVILDGGELEIGFNVRYLADALRVIPCEEVTLELTNGLSPIVMTPVDDKYDFAYMVLPVRIKSN